MAVIAGLECSVAPDHSAVNVISLYFILFFIVQAVSVSSTTSNPSRLYKFEARFALSTKVSAECGLLQVWRAGSAGF